jgi:DNA-binding NarL/FixJ family response regulator
MEQVTKVMIVEDHAIFREGLKMVLREMKGVELVGEAENGAEALKLLKHITPDIILMDIKMPVMDGIEATERALKMNPKLKIIVLTMFGEEEYLFSMIQKGICGFLLKSSSMTNLERAISLVSDGQQYYTAEINGILAKRIRQYERDEIPRFTGKENEVLRLLCKGYSTGEMSDNLHISRRTVEGYRARLLEKTNQSNTINLVIFALRNKLVTVEELGKDKL